MNKNKLAIVVGTALYTAGVAASANQVTPVGVDLMALHQAQQKIKENTNTSQYLNPLRNGAYSNVQFTPKTDKDKFKLDQNDDGQRHTYIIQLTEKPIATYDGSIKGLQATRASSNQQAKLFSSNGQNSVQPAIDAYRKHLLNKQNVMVQKAQQVGVPVSIRQQFTTAINGISAELTQSEAQRLAQLPEVQYIQKSRNYELHSDVGPEHIGAGGVWDGSAIANEGKYTGEGMLVGILDTGINTEHPSFAAKDGEGYFHTNPLGSGNFLGECSLAEFAQKCNDKLIGVYTHPNIAASYFSEPANPWEQPVQLAPAFGEDFNGHGSHVASTVAGNILFEVDDLAPSYGGGSGDPIGVKMPKVSGVAPRANIISYQVCYPVGGCDGEAMLFAIEQAIKDGVDVINMSIGGGENFPWDDAFEMAFLSAREAGVAVALSAGNSGAANGTDSLYTVDHTSPWVLNVAATTHARYISVDGKSLTDFSGGDESLIPDTLDGAGVSESFSGTFVLASDYGDARCNTPFAEGTFDKNHIVVCERGDIARFQKAINVQAGGAGGFVLYNTSAEGDSVNDDVYVIPGIHLSEQQFYGNWQVKGLKPWLESGTELKGTITASEAKRVIDNEKADWLASFSSRGPSQTVDEIFSPGIAAPGVDIFAAWTEENPFVESADTRDWNRISGTSMASPHLAGAMTLVRQARPNWSASEVQSALQMTANSKAIKMKHARYEDVINPGPYRVGHGLVNVADAINAGLVMDETADNFRRANPHNGGRVRDLNLPQLVNRDCGLSCSWTRTITATKDGSWTVNVEKAEKDQMFDEWTLDPSAKMSVTPSQFSLKAGDSITLTITSQFSEADMAWYDGTVQYDQGEIQFIAEDPNMPVSTWPYSSQYQGKVLPNTLHVTASDDNAQSVVKDVPFGIPASSIIAVAYEPVLLQTKTVTLPRQQANGMDTLTDSSGYFSIDEMPWITTIDIAVPSNAALLTAELMEVVSSTNDPDPLNAFVNADMFIVRDYNNDGRIHFSEAICGSMLAQTTAGEFCTIENPEAGDYKLVIANNYLYPATAQDTIAYRHAVVAKSETSDISLDFAASESAELNADMTISWNKDMLSNTQYLSAIAVNAPNSEAGSLALIPLSLKRGANTVSVIASQTDALVGDRLDFEMVIQANKSGQDRDIAVNVTVPEGLTLDAASITQVEGLTLTESGFAINTAQVNSADWPTQYRMTTNENDMMCRTPWDLPGVNGGYVNLKEFGINPSWGSIYEVNEWGWGNWAHDVNVPVYTDKGRLTPFDNEVYFYTDQIVVSSKGFVQLDAVQYNAWDIFPHNVHMELPSKDYGTPPDFIFAPFHNANLDMNWNQEFTLAKYAPHWDRAQESGVSMAYLGDYILVEWDNAKTVSETFDENWNRQYEDRDDSYDYQMFLSQTTNYRPGQYEVIMAYDNIDFATQQGLGSIGLRGYTGPRAGFNPLYGHSGVSFAFNDLKDKVKSGLVVCYDIVSSESSRITVNFSAMVNSHGIGDTQTVYIDGSVQGVTSALANTDINVAANLAMVALDDAKIDENTSLQGVVINYTDADGGRAGNTITLTGDNIVGEVSGHNSGSTLTITPNANWHGQTEVTVTVSDNVFKNDSVSQSFMLTVVSDGVELGCTDSSATNYNADANSDDGSCTYPVEKKKSSGSLLWLLGLTGLFFIRRRFY